MVNAIGSSNINAINMFSALNAFKSNDKITNETTAPEISDGIDINDSSILATQDLDEIKQMAQVAGEENLSNEDIQYGLTYGRSVIADYIA